MKNTSLQEQLIQYLEDAHHVEEEALARVRAAAARVTDPVIGSVLRLHLLETEEQEQIGRDCLKDLGARVEGEDFFGFMSGKTPPPFTTERSDSTGRLLAYVFLYTHLKIAAYKLVELCAEETGEARVATIARGICAQETEMTRHLSALYDRALAVSRAEKSHLTPAAQLNTSLTDLYALEEQTMRLLARGIEATGDEQLLVAFSARQAETRRYQRMIFGRLQKRDVNPTLLTNSKQRIGELNFAAFSHTEPGAETPAELAAFIYASEQLEIAFGELLRRLASLAGDVDTVITMDGILANQRSSARQMHSLLNVALEASLRQQGFREVTFAASDQPTLV